MKSSFEVKGTYSAFQIGWITRALLADRQLSLRSIVLGLNEMVLVLDGEIQIEYEYEYRRRLSTSTKGREL